MTEDATGCKTMSQDDFLKIIENNPILKEKLEQIGIDQDLEGLNITLNYSDLLTKDEKKSLKKQFKKFGFNPKKDADHWYIKFGSRNGDFFVCLSDVVCDNCYKGLLDYRK
ncbi:hypothetical protein H2O64_17030 [Kordia sp. YSTF-M3]|uniref:Nif11 domain-containing protein n=1 Tax=Kordia aestuariivivens TaxID=2759037 RepID=A0ABR7QCY2_9FLAO|nr:hypothetical protein [Kordia aestuariivivens]MBC8756382.1 hypothetical protein [Kordia aestuariivivens]